MSTRNSQMHYLCSDLVTVNFTDHAGHRRRITANLEEIAPHRLSLLMDSRIPAGTRATIETKGLTLRGCARRAEHSQNLGWFIEIRLAPESRWSRDRFSPEHLLAATLPPQPVFCRHSSHAKANA